MQWHEVGMGNTWTPGVAQWFELKLKTNWSLEISLELDYVFYVQALLCIQSVNKHSPIKKESTGLGKTILWYYNISIIIPEWGSHRVRANLVGLCWRVCAFRSSQVSFMEALPQFHAAFTKIARGTPPFPTRSINLWWRSQSSSAGLSAH